MNTPENPAVELPRLPPEGWPEAVIEEWCRMHRLIDELSSVQHRLGTPLEEPEDFLKVRTLGSDIREKLDRLSPWLAATPELVSAEIVE